MTLGADWAAGKAPWGFEPLAAGNDGADRKIQNAAKPRHYAATVTPEQYARDLPIARRALRDLVLAGDKGAVLTAALMFVTQPEPRPVADLPRRGFWHRKTAA